MLKTTYTGETVPHRLLWEIVEEQARLASELEREWSKPALVAMVFGFHTVEAYLNFVGERLDPETWQNERDFGKYPLDIVNAICRLAKTERHKRAKLRVHETKGLSQVVQSGDRAGRVEGCYEEGKDASDRFSSY